MKLRAVMGVAVILVAAIATSSADAHAVGNAMDKEC